MESAKIYNWNPDKNQLLAKEQGITFERIISAIGSGDELAVLDHPNQEKYPG